MSDTQQLLSCEDIASADGGLTVSDTKSQLIGPPFLESIFLAYSNVKKRTRRGSWVRSVPLGGRAVCTGSAAEPVSREQGKLIVNVP